MMSMTPICGPEWMTSASTKYGMNPNMSIRTSDFAVKGESGELVLKVPSQEFKPGDSMNVLSSDGHAMFTLTQGKFRCSYTMYIMSSDVHARWPCLATIKTARMNSCQGFIYAGEQQFDLFNNPRSGDPPVLCFNSSAGVSNFKVNVASKSSGEKALKEQRTHTNVKFYNRTSFDAKDVVAWTSYGADSLEDTFSLDINAGQDAALILAAMICANEMMEGALRGLS